MSQVKHYQAKKGLKLDCGHEVREGESFAVTRVFTCEADAPRVLFAKAKTPEAQPAALDSTPSPAQK